MQNAATLITRVKSIHILLQKKVGYFSFWMHWLLFSNLAGFLPLTAFINYETCSENVYKVNYQHIMQNAENLMVALSSAGTWGNISKGSALIVCDMVFP